MFHVGDLVRVRNKICDKYNVMSEYYNKIGIVKDFDEEEPYPYSVHFSEDGQDWDNFMWSELELFYET